MAHPIMSDETIKTEEILLHLLKSEADVVFDGHAIESFKLDSNYSPILRAFVYRLHTMIPAENMKEEIHVVSVEYPDGWWNAFKEQYFPKYILKRFPVKYATKRDTVKFTAYMLYPRLPRVLRGSTERQIIIKEVLSD